MIDREAIARIVDPAAYDEAYVARKTHVWGSAEEAGQHQMLLRDKALAKADAILAALAPQRQVPPGWKIVPIQPTEAMIEAARNGAGLAPSRLAVWRKGLLANWRAMLATANEPFGGVS